ncbi:MAG: hypothetical protein ABI454_09210 [Sphingomicrobium sp.]
MNGAAGWIASVVTGAILWSVASVSLARREPWDAPSYWTLWYPAAVVAAAALGYFFPRRSWRWPVVLMLMQLPVMMFVTGSDASLLPLGAALLLALSIPGMMAAMMGAAVARRFRSA